MDFLKRNHKLCALVLAVILCGGFSALIWSGFFGVPVPSDYHIPHPHYQLSLYQNGKLFTGFLDSEKLDEVSAVVRSVRNQRLAFSAKREPEEEIHIQWGNLHFYPTCYSNSKWNYTCDNYEEVYERLKAIAESLPERPPVSDE